MFKTLQVWAIIGLLGLGMTGYIAYQYQTIKRKDAEMHVVVQQVEAQRQTIEYWESELAAERARHAALQESRKTSITSRDARVDATVESLADQLGGRK